MHTHTCMHTHTDMDSGRREWGRKSGWVIWKPPKVVRGVRVVRWTSTREDPALIGNSSVRERKKKKTRLSRMCMSAVCGRVSQKQTFRLFCV